MAGLLIPFNSEWDLGPAKDEEELWLKYNELQNTWNSQIPNRQFSKETIASDGRIAELVLQGWNHVSD